MPGSDVALYAKTTIAIAFNMQSLFYSFSVSHCNAISKAAWLLSLVAKSHLNSDIAEIGNFLFSCNRVALRCDLRKWPRVNRPLPLRFQNIFTWFSWPPPWRTFETNWSDPLARMWRMAMLEIRFCNHNYLDQLQIGLTTFSVASISSIIIGCDRYSR